MIWLIYHRVAKFWHTHIVIIQSHNAKSLNIIHVTHVLQSAIQYEQSTGSASVDDKQCANGGA